MKSSSKSKFYDFNTFQLKQDRPVHLLLGWYIKNTEKAAACFSFRNPSDFLFYSPLPLPSTSIQSGKAFRADPFVLGVDP